MSLFLVTSACAQPKIAPVATAKTTPIASTTASAPVVAEPPGPGEPPFSIGAPEFAIPPVDLSKSAWGVVARGALAGSASHAWTLFEYPGDSAAVAITLSSGTRRTLGGHLVVHGGLGASLRIVQNVKVADGVTLLLLECERRSRPLPNVLDAESDTVHDYLVLSVSDETVRVALPEAPLVATARLESSDAGVDLVATCITSKGPKSFGSRFDGVSATFVATTEDAARCLAGWW